MRGKSKLVSRSQGFTLVELSIVIIIIGFLIAGIAAGQSLINNAKLNSVIQDMQQYTVAINNFASRYSALPGDLDVAGAFWPSCDPTPTNCNGNMNGVVEWPDEAMRAFQHLSLAGITKFNYSAAAPFPQAKFGQETQWSITSNSLQTYAQAPNTRSALFFWVWPTNKHFISSVDAYSIDQKIDDGNPSDGIMLAYNGDACVTEPDGVTPAISTVYLANDAIYNLKNPSSLCERLSFYLN